LLLAGACFFQFAADDVVAKQLDRGIRREDVEISPTAHREAETAKAHRG